MQIERMKVKKTSFHKLYFVCFFLLFFSSNIDANVVFQLNKTNSFLIFSEAIMGKNSRSEIHKKLYEKEYKNNQLYAKKLLQLTQDYSKIKTARIYNYQKSNNLLSALIIESAFVNSLDELERKIMNNYKVSIKKELLKRYFKTLRLFYPIFEKHIWNPNYKELKVIQGELNRLLKKIDIKKMTQKIAHFYHLEAQDIRTLYVSLYPIKNGKSFKAIRLENTASVGVIIKKRKLNLKWLLSAVILHEYCHELYGHNKKRIQNMYNFKILKNRKMERIFDESLQTSISAGYIYSKLTNKLFDGRWYNNKKYDLFAKLIYSEVSEYLDNNQALDKKFLKKIESIYNKIK